MSIKANHLVDFSDQRTNIEILVLLQTLFSRPSSTRFGMCILCKTLIVYKTQTGTGGLKKHINAFVERTAMKDQTTLDDFIGSTKLSGSSTENNRKSGASSLPKYLRRNLNRAFVEFSAFDCRSFETISGLGFTRLINQVFRAGQSMKSNSFNIESLIPSTRPV